jgi:hypothetical protein
MKAVHKPPKPGAQVRVLAGAYPTICRGVPLWPPSPHHAHHLTAPIPAAAPRIIYDDKRGTAVANQNPIPLD